MRGHGVVMEILAVCGIVIGLTYLARGLRDALPRTRRERPFGTTLATTPSLYRGRVGLALVGIGIMTISAARPFATLSPEGLIGWLAGMAASLVGVNLIGLNRGAPRWMKVGTVAISAAALLAMVIVLLLHAS